MSQEDYAVYVDSVDEQARRELALAYFMGWMAGATETGSMLSSDDIEAARDKAEEMFGTSLLAFGRSESAREE